MRLIAREEFASIGLRGPDGVVADVRLERCVFGGCSLVQHDDPGFGMVVRDVVATGCRLTRCSVHGVRFEDVLIDGLAISSMLYLAASVFKHVTLRGKVGAMMTTPPHYALSQAMQDAFALGAQDFYKDVDWALDIADAEFSDAEFYCVPGHLVRRDEKTQFLVHRDRFAGRDLSGLPSSARHVADRFDEMPFDSYVAVAPKRSKYFEKLRIDFEVLRSEGLAD